MFQWCLLAVLNSYFLPPIIILYPSEQTPNLVIEFKSNILPQVLVQACFVGHKHKYMK
jgi:hypothetical protein